MFFLRSIWGTRKRIALSFGIGIIIGSAADVFSLQELNTQTPYILLASILLLFAFLGIGTGAIEYLHNLEHQATSQSHDESNCPTHAILRASAVLSAVPPLLCLTEEQPDRVTIVSPSLPSQHTPTRIDCRGPPIC